MKSIAILIFYPFPCVLVQLNLLVLIDMQVCWQNILVLMKFSRNHLNSIVVD